MSFANLLTARLAFELLILDTCVTYTDIPFQIPVLGKNPLITVGNTCTKEVAFEAVVFQFRPDAPGHIDGGSLIDASMHMESHKVSIELVAEPVTEFRLDGEHLHHLLIFVFPRIIVGIQVQR